MEKNIDIKKIEKELKKLSKGKGYVVADDLNKYLESDDISPEDIDEIYSFLSENEIEVVSADLDGNLDMPVKEEKKTKKKESKEVNAIKTMDERKQDLLQLGKQIGILTFEQLANSLKGLEMDAESLDDLYNFLRENNIEVV